MKWTADFVVHMTRHNRFGTGQVQILNIVNSLVTANKSSWLFFASFCSSISWSVNRMGRHAGYNSRLVMQD